MPIETAKDHTATGIRGISRDEYCAVDIALQRVAEDYFANGLATDIVRR